jgi:hypothetical protein
MKKLKSSAEDSSRKLAMEAICHKYETLHDAAMEYDVTTRERGVSQLWNWYVTAMELVCHNYGTWCVTITERGVSQLRNVVSQLWN